MGFLLDTKKVGVLVGATAANWACVHVSFFMSPCKFSGGSSPRWPGFVRASSGVSSGVSSFVSFCIALSFSSCVSSSVYRSSSCSWSLAIPGPLGEKPFGMLLILFFLSSIQPGGACARVM